MNGHGNRHEQNEALFRPRGLFQLIPATRRVVTPSQDDAGLALAHIRTLLRNAERDRRAA